MKKYEITFRGEVRMVIEATGMYEAKRFAERLSNRLYGDTIGLRIKEIECPA